MCKPLKDKLPKAYDPSMIEQQTYRFWEEGKYFEAADTSGKPPYCIVLPPPNITGALHMGHALTATVQDMLVRWKRMQGYNALWLPGSDHAGIATQMVVERQLKNEGTDRHALGREKFTERVWEWKEKYGSRITEQHKRLGASLDWSRERFTMDEGASRAVREAFCRLYEKGRIVRDNRLINWCISCRTALSDVEVDRDKPEMSEMWSFAYELEEGGEIVVATTRPETMLGDTAVVVHPEDERYKDLIGKMLKHPFQDRSIPIVADDILADPELGTGAVKVTPAHDPNDFECGKRHDLPLIDILTDEGRINENGAPFEGLDRFEARKKVKEALAEKGLFRGRADHEYAPGRCLRCRTVVEPKLSLQWFVDTGDMSQRAMDEVRNGRTSFVPPHQEHRYFDWLDKKIPWCVSRQLWWGHRIPAWYCDDCDHVTVSREEPTQCAGCGSKRIEQDSDVLDTWFSSGLWPFSTLGWPEETPALKTFYPTAVLETGYDIITFWVSRMMMQGLELMDDIPFHKVLLHPMVRDQDGNKMSKSRGNVIDPLDVVEGISLDDLITKTRGYTLPEEEIERAVKYQQEHYPNGFQECGTDALRFTLAAYTGQDQDIRFSVERVEGYRKFCNKIWQAVMGFAMPHLEGMEASSDVPTPATLADRWILHRLSQVAAEVNEGLEAFKVGEVTQTLYHFFWNDLCSWYIELQKPVLTGDDREKKAAGQQVLRHALDVSLRLLHPLMPFVTEVLWQELPRSKGDPQTIMLARFPEATDGTQDPNAVEEAAVLMETITAIRAVRSEYNVAPSKELPVVLATSDDSIGNLLGSSFELLRSLARVSDLKVIGAEEERPADCATAVAKDVEVFIPLAGMVDVAAEEERLVKEREKAVKDIEFAKRKLSNEKFVSKAPPQVVAKEKERMEDAASKLEKIDEAITRLAAMKGQ